MNKILMSHPRMKKILMSFPRRREFVISPKKLDSRLRGNDKCGRLFFTISFLILSILVSHAKANDVSIEHVEFVKRGDSWRVNTTLLHNDTGWEHYADAWRVVDENDNELGKRVLFHPHENEQPFTRSLPNLNIPAGINIVYIEAHDKVHGWSKKRVRVDLKKNRGEKYRVKKN